MIQMKHRHHILTSCETLYMMIVCIADTFHDNFITQVKREEEQGRAIAEEFVICYHSPHIESEKIKYCAEYVIALFCCEFNTSQ